jgi:thiamine-monophosphate kinase
MTTLADLGEFGLIARLTGNLNIPAGVITGVGDDAAVLRFPPGEVVLATCDAQVEDTHFRLGSSTPESIGWRALTVNVSDIAAMGGQPHFALISLLAPPTLDVAVLDGIYAGLRMAGDHYKTAIVGGNVARHAERLILDITLLGSGDPAHILRRSGSQPGDIIMVTGTLGAAAAGLLVQEHPDLDISTTARATVLAAQQRPVARVAAGQWLAANGASAAVDISDGLAADLGHICSASGVGAIIHASMLPIDEATDEVALAVGKDPIDLALNGGEDYELLCVIPQRYIPEVENDILEIVGNRVKIIGEITTGDQMLLEREGVSRPLLPSGWDHMIR